MNRVYPKLYFAASQVGENFLNLKKISSAESQMMVSRVLTLMVWGNLRDALYVAASDARNFHIIMDFDFCDFCLPIPG